MSGEILEREILEQPARLESFLKDESSVVGEIAAALRGRFRYVVIAARGTSDNAARYAKYLLGAHNRISVALATPSLFTLYKQPPSMEGALVIGISQSGRPPDIVSVLAEARQQGCPTLAITNQPGSPLAETADYTVNLRAGEEKAVAATKTYTASLAAMALFSAHLAQDTPRLDALQALPSKVAETLRANQVVLQTAERYRYMEHCAVIGRGFNYATAFEISLKIKELTQTVAEPYSSADFLHGPIALIHRGFPVMVISPSGAVFEDLRGLIRRLQSLRAELLLIGDEDELLGEAHLAMPIAAGVPEWLSPVLTVLPGQLFALALARARGLDPDQPPGLTKVTETW